MTAHLAPWQPLYPSQRSGALLFEWGVWEGMPREFQVQWHEDRVYFKLRHGGSDVWASLDTCCEAEAVSCFREALVRERYGLCFRHNLQISYGSRYFRYYLQLIYAPDGTGWLREWSSREWIFFAPQETRAWALFPDMVLPRDHDQRRPWAYYAAQSVRELLMFRRVSDEEIERLSWKSATDKGEFWRVVRLLWEAKIFTVDAKSKQWGSVSLMTHAQHIRSQLAWYGVQERGHPDLFLWLHSYFVGEGFHWQTTDWGTRRFSRLRASEPHLRVFLEPYPVYWRFPFIHCADPSFHEQLEARLELRDWLGDKVPGVDIDKWLSPP